MSKYLQYGHLYKDEDDANRSTAPEHFRRHPIMSGTYGMISGEAPRFAAQHQGHDTMKAHLNSMGLRHEETHGSYGGPEKSFIVYNPTREQMYHLGKKFGQEAVIHGQGGKHEMLYTNGPNEGKYHPSLGKFGFWEKEPPEDYWTHIPGHGHLRLYFDENKLLDSPVRHDATLATGIGNVTQKDEVPWADFLGALHKTIKKALNPKPYPHPHAYAWHDPHTDHHYKVVAHGGVLVRNPDLMKAMGQHPHVDGAKPGPNKQAAGPGVESYAKHALPYGQIDKSSPSDLMHYPYQGHGPAINNLIKQHGYATYYAGGQHGRPDLSNKNYNTKHLMIYDPTPASGGDFGQHEYTDNWRKLHELAHALTYPTINEKYGEGRRLGRLGAHRTVREAKRAVEWEHLATHKQRELSKQLGIHIPDDVFNKEYNTVMHDSAHRAITGKFTEPSQEGFRPHAHQVPLGVAMQQIDEAAHNLQLGPHDLLKKAERPMADEKEYDVNEVRAALVKTIKDRIDAYTDELVNLRKKEASLEKVSPPGKYKDLPEKLKEEGHSPESAFAIAWSAYKKGKKHTKSELEKAFEESHPSGDGGMGMMMKEREVKKNAFMGYGPQTGAVQNQVPGGGNPSMNKAELCKECGYEHMAGEHKLKKDIKVKVKVKVKGVDGKEVKEEAKKSEDYIDMKSENDPKKRLKNVGAEGVMPDDKKSKVIEEEGSGGEIVAGKKMAKAAMGASASKTGMPAAPKAAMPKMPKAPTAGAGGTGMAKQELGKAGAYSGGAVKLPKPKKPKATMGNSVSMTSVTSAPPSPAAGGVSGPGAVGKAELHMEKAAMSGAAIPPPIPGKARPHLPGIDIGKPHLGIGPNPAQAKLPYGGKPFTMESIASNPAQPMGTPKVKLPGVGKVSTPPMGAGSPNPGAAKK